MRSGHSVKEVAELLEKDLEVSHKGGRRTLHIHQVIYNVLYKASGIYTVPCAMDVRFQSTSLVTERHFDKPRLH